MVYTSLPRYLFVANQLFSIPDLSVPPLVPPSQVVSFNPWEEQAQELFLETIRR